MHDLIHAGWILCWDGFRIPGWSDQGAVNKLTAALLTQSRLLTTSFSSLQYTQLEIGGEIKMTVIDKPKFDPSTTTPSADNPSDLPSHEQTSGNTPNGDSKPSGMAPSQNPSKPKTPPVPVTSLKDPSLNPVKRVLGTKRKFSASTDILEPRPIPGLPATEEPNESSMSKRLRVLEAGAKAELASSLKKPTRSIHVNIRPMLGEPFTVSISDDSYTFELKEMIAERTGLTLSGVILSFPGDGKMLTDDEQLISATGITEGSTLNLTVKVSSGVEPALNYEYDFGDDDGSEEVEFYDVVYPIPDGTDSRQNETLADFVKLLEDERSTVTVKDGTTSTSSGSSGSNTESFPMIEISLPGTYKSISRLFEDRPRRPHIPDLGALDDLDSLKISNSEEDDRYHEELLKSALGPRGAEIFRSPSLTPVQEPSTEPIVSSLTGASCCSQCGKKCKLAQRFECKCGKTFCPQHRYYDQHACTFDFKAKDRALVEKANPKVVKEKIEKI